MFPKCSLELLLSFIGFLHLEPLLFLFSSSYQESLLLSGLRECIAFALHSSNLNSIPVLHMILQHFSTSHSWIWSQELSLSMNGPQTKQTQEYLLFLTQILHFNLLMVFLFLTSLVYFSEFFVLHWPDFMSQSSWLELI